MTLLLDDFQGHAHLLLAATQQTTQQKLLERYIR